MSGFAVHLDFARPATPDRLTTVAQEIAYRGPHRQTARTIGPCTLMHAALWTTPEAEDEDQPQRHVTRDFCLAADARVDNRDELTDALQASTRQPLHTDADFILAAYERWGADLVHHVVGDFAFVLWDGEREELLITRDHLGSRPLFVAQIPHGVVAGSTLPAVLAGINGEPGVDETYLAGFLHGLSPRDRTIWTGVERLAPGHRRRVARDRVVTDRYWSPNLEPLVQPIEDTVELTRTLFEEAVRCRLRTRDGIASDVSGGFDSSTVTATAARLGADVHPISLVYRSDPEAFELLYIGSVIDHLGLDGNLIEADDLVTLDPIADIRTHQEPLYSVDATDTAARYDVMTSLGISVSLTGMGGDELLHGGSGRWLDLLRWSVRETAMRWTSSHRAGLVARGARAVRMRNARRHRPWLRVPPPPWPAPAPRVGSRAAAARLSGYEGPWNLPAYELTERLAAERGIEARHPFQDRRLVELGLRLPDEQTKAGGEPRGLHRLAFGHLLPSSVTSREGKAEFSASYRRRMHDRQSREDVAEALTALGDRIDPAAVLSAFTQDPGRPVSPSIWHQWWAISAGIALSGGFRHNTPHSADTISPRNDLPTEA